MLTTQEHKRNLLNEVRYALQTLYDDRQLVKEGYEFYDVVDFAAIYAYVYKKAGTPFITPKGEPEEKTYARCQIALKMLFSEYPRGLLLIPPYSRELQDHILFMKAKVGLAELDVSALYKEKLKRMIAGSKQFKQYLDARLQFPGKVDKKLSSEALEVGKSYFPELYAALIISSGGQIDTFGKLVKKQRVLDADKVLPECKNISYHGDKTNIWYERVSKQRGNQRALQSYTDALACHYIEEANAMLNASRKVVVFVSPSARVKDAISSWNLAEAGGKQISVVRDLTYCMLAAVHKDDDILKENLDNIETLHRLYNSPIPIEWEARDKREKAAMLWKGCENILLMDASNVRDTEPQNVSSDRDRDFLNLLATLTSGDDTVARQRKEEMAELKDRIHDLSKRLPPPRREELPIKTISVRLSAIAGGVPVTFHFSQPHVVTLVNRLKQTQASETSGEDLELLIQHILEQVLDRQDLIPEEGLLAGYLLAARGSYVASLDILDKARSAAHYDTLNQIFYLTAVVRAAIGQAQEGCALLAQALKQFPENPRLMITLTRLFWLRWRISDHLEEANFLLGDSIELAKTAELQKLRQDEVTQAVIQDMLAVLYTERALLVPITAEVDLEQAFYHLGQLESMMPDAMWPPRFFCTRGYWKYAKARHLGTSNASWLILLDAAAKDLERVRIAEAETPQDIEIRRIFQMMIMDEIKKRTEADVL